MPLHLPNGSLVQGMVGSAAQPGATANGLVMKHFSADGTHFVFSSTSQFESDGNNSTGDVSIYDRNLATNTTQVVSKDPLGNNLTCNQGAGSCHAPGDGAGISELDISGDGSRIVVGQLISTDADGNRYFHLYMHVGQRPAHGRPDPGRRRGRPLRRHDRGRVEGVLHDDGQTAAQKTRTRARTSTKRRSRRGRPDGRG